MISIGHTQLWVHDQDEALAFWTEKVGMEVRSDVTVPEMGNFRWLAVGPPPACAISMSSSAFSLIRPAFLRPLAPACSCAL